MSANRITITSPVGRIVEGNLYTPNSTDFDGNPLVVKNGSNAGQPRKDFYFALAIPKGAETHWSQTPWGAKIVAVGQGAFPQAALRPDFAWKIVDGDSRIPNKKNTIPADKEGYPGHWVLRFRGGFAPKIYQQEGSGFVQVMQVGFIKPGYFAEVSFTVDDNGNQNNPGVYLNHSLICFRAYGPEIVFGPNVDEAGFGQAPLPAGASLTPAPSAIPLPAAAAAPVPVTPNPQFLQVPLANPIAAPAPVAPAPIIPVVPTPAPSSGPTLTAKALAENPGVTLVAYRAAGWTDALLIEKGYLTA